ncbi:MAG: SpoIIE family protein phosphatase [Bacteroidota bacterium]
MDNSFTRYAIEDRSYVAFIKKEIHTKAVLAKFGEIEIGKIDIIVSEITSNLIKHAGAGELLYRVMPNEVAGPLLEIICIDKGPGIKDVSHAMKDGISTTKTLGGGLGSMERLSGLFQVLSMPDWGTVLYSRTGATRNSGMSHYGTDIDARAFLVPKHHEEVCGDGYAVIQNKSYAKILFGDGLGHGTYAAEAVETAKDFFFSCDENEPVVILKGMHEHVRRTRGLVATVAVLDKKAGTWSICGVGNINTRMYTGIEYRTYMAYNGTLGLNVPNSMKSTQVPLERNQHIFMCSDGITTRWNLNRYPYIFKYDPLLVAAVIYKDFSRGNDDASVLIAKMN